MVLSRTRRVLVVDGLLALLLLAAALVAGAVGEAGSTPVALPVLGTVLAAGACGATWGRRLEPVLAFGVVLALVAVSVLGGYPYLPVLLPLLVALAAVGLHAPLARSVVAAAAALVVTLTAFSVASLLQPEPDPRAGLLMAAWTGWVLAPWATGAALRLRGELARTQDVAAELQETATTATEAARRAEARQADDAARMRVARLVHDAVGDDLAAVAMRCAVALHVADHRPGDARLALRAVRDRSEASLRGMRQARPGLLDGGGAVPEQAPDGVWEELWRGAVRRATPDPEGRHRPTRSRQDRAAEALALLEGEDLELPASVHATSGVGGRR